MTPAEVAEVLKLAEKTVKDWLRAGKLQGVKIGKVWRVRRVDLEAYIEESMKRTGQGDDRNK